MEDPSRFQNPKKEVVAFGIKVEPVPSTTLVYMEGQLESTTSSPSSIHS